MQQSVEQRWSKLQGEVSSSTLYWSIQGSLSRTNFSTFQSVSYRRKTNLWHLLCLTTGNNKKLWGLFSVMVCIPFWGTAVGRWRRAHRAERPNELSLKTREPGEERGCQPGETLNLWVSFHPLASLAPWNQHFHDNWSISFCVFMVTKTTGGGKGYFSSFTL